MIDRTTNWLDSRARLNPDKLAVVDVKEGLRLSYKELNQRVNYLAGYLKQLVFSDEYEETAQVLQEQTQIPFWLSQADYNSCLSKRSPAN